MKTHNTHPGRSFVPNGIYSVGDKKTEQTKKQHKVITRTQEGEIIYKTSNSPNSINFSGSVSLVPRYFYSHLSCGKDCSPSRSLPPLSWVAFWDIWYLDKDIPAGVLFSSSPLQPRPFDRPLCSRDKGTAWLSGMSFPRPCTLDLSIRSPSSCIGHCCNISPPPRSLSWL